MKELNKVLMNKKGITLVALVITIIVLLIIIGINISMLTGDNSILKKSLDAKKSTYEANKFELIKLSISESYDQNGVIQKNELKNNILKNIKNSSIKNNEFPLLIEIDDTKYYINIDGTIQEISYENKEFIKGTGTQYIDTGVHPSNTIDFEIIFRTEVNSISVSDCGRESFFGGFSSDINRTIGFNFGGKSNQKQIFLWKNNTYANGAKIISFGTTQYNPINKITIASKGDEWIVNNVKLGKADSVGEWKDETITLTVFGQNRNNKTSIFYEIM